MRLRLRRLAVNCGRRLAGARLGANPARDRLAGRPGCVFDRVGAVLFGKPSMMRGPAAGGSGGCDNPRC